MPPSPPRQRLPVLGASIDALSETQAVQRLLAWGQARESRVVCICNVHSVVTATQDADYRRLLDDADLATPDGAPVAWMMRRLGAKAQRRVSGPDLMLAACAEAARAGPPIYLYGSTEPTLQALAGALTQRFPGLQIAGWRSPPFRPLSAEEDAAEVAAINASGAGLVWVGLGCPKQERWMTAHRGRVQAAMIGVGAAFDFHAGAVQRAPAWMRNHGLEWLHRLGQEPGRLWRRYLVTNTLFVLGAAAQLLRGGKA